MAFIAEHRHKYGVEGNSSRFLICEVLRGHGVGIAPNTYHVAKDREPSNRQLRDEGLKIEIRRLFDENLSVSGADEVWTQLNRENITVARCTVERLMRDMGHGGCLVPVGANSTRSRPHLMTGLNGRQIWWIASSRRIRGWVYVVLIVDVYSRMVVGWQASRSPRSDLAIDALEMAMWNRQRAWPRPGRAALAQKANTHVTQIRRYEAGTSTPTLDVLRNLALALNTSADSLLFETNERGPNNDLKLHLEAINQIDKDEQQTIKHLIEGALLRHQAKKLAG